MKFRGEQKKYGAWAIPVSVHPEPRKGWGATNELSRAWMDTVSIEDFLSDKRFMESRNHNVSERHCCFKETFGIRT